jgi:hypothetical protein
VEQRATRIALGVWSALVVLFLWLPLALIILYAFNKSNVQSWPIPAFTTHWFRAAWTSEVRTSLWLSVRVGLVATGIALVLGSAAAFGVARFRFFGREAVSFLLVLPIALPGIVTGIALNSAFVAGSINLSQWTIVVGHATFCVVVVYNNVLARLRRSSPSLIEAGSRRRRLADVPLRHLAGPLHRPRRRGPARLRAVVRRGHRHDVHGGLAEHDPASHPGVHPAGPAAAGGERDRVHDDRLHRRPGAARTATHAGHRRPPPDGRERHGSRRVSADNRRIGGTK